MNRRIASHTARRGPVGFTLVELLLAVTITAIIGVAVATLLTAASRGMTITRSSQSALQRAHALQSRLRSYTDSALCLLQYRKDDALAIWLEDTDTDGRVCLCEVRVFWFDDDAGTMSVERAEFPAEWTDEEIELFDLALTPGSDFITEMTALRGLGYTKTETLADGLASVELTWNEIDLQADPRAALRMGLRIDEEESKTLIACIGMPYHTQPQ